MKVNCSKPLLLFYLAVIHLVIPTAAQYYCYVTGNYTSNSTYRANLNTLLASMYSNTQIDYGFYNFSAGESPNKVNAIVLCRGDVSPDLCRTCINESSSTLLQSCPNQKEAIIWAEKCVLRFSHRSIFNTLDTDPLLSYYATGNVPDVEAFNKVLKPLLDSLRNRTASGNSTHKFALQSVPVPNFETIYALLECTPDLSRLDCNNCLSQVQVYIPQCCNGKQGGRFVTPSCDIRYEIYSFYDPAAEPPPSPPPPPSLVPSAASPSPELPTTTPEKRSNSSKTIIIIVVAVVVFMTLIICICVSLRVKKQMKKVEMDEISKTESLQFDFPTIRVATDNFSDANKLGRGGFGFVYKGRLSDGKEIAVKRLSMNSGQGDLEFKNEISIVAKLQHRNLVKLRGFCFEGIERLLIYEFVPNGSLDQVIFDTTKRANLDWQMRYKIIVGIARGLLYLHEDSRLRIIHRDLKPSNILLDAEMNPKIADFGLAKLVLLNQTQSNTNRIVGTYGYMAPEYASYGHFSVKSDVFSFGVLVLEMVCGEKNSYFHNSGEYLLNYAWKNWRNMTTSNIIDPILGVGSTTEIIRCIHIGLLCVQENVANRPTMGSVILMLNSDSITLSVPSRPAFFIHSNVEPDSQSDQSILLASTNDASITALRPR